MKNSVLIVEDDVDIAENLKEILAIEGIPSEIAHDGCEAMTMLRRMSEKPDVILLDLMMPVMDGFEFRRLQRNDPLISEIPVFVMTAGGNIEPKIHPLEISGYFRKPLDIDNLIEAIRHI